VHVSRVVLILAVSILAVPAAAVADQHRQAFLPPHGVLISGKSLAGIRLGATPADVEATWGNQYNVCDGCKLTTWYYTYPAKTVGAGVMFDQTNHVVAVFTLGQPAGWRTQKGLWLGADVHDLVAMYDGPHMAYKACIGFTALSSRSGAVITSIFTQAEQVYGFALTSPGAPVCL